MKMKGLSCVCAAALAAAGARADGEASEEAVAAEGGAEAVSAAAQEKDSLKWFFTLPLCRRVQGRGDVLKPGSSEWQPVEEGRFYPLGSSYRAAAENSKLVIAFGKACTVTVENGASFSTRPQKLGEPARTIALTGGEVAVSLPSNLKTGLFSVTTPGFEAVNLCGESRYVYAATGDGFEADVRCVTGTLEVRGHHYRIPAMRAADVVRIRTTNDDLQTILYGKSGDYVVKLDRGEMYVPETQEDGTVKDVVQSNPLDWHLSVSTRVQINRAVPSIGERMSVTMMTFDSAGQMKNHFAYTEKRPEVNTGELVVRPAADAADVAKRAAEVTTEAAAAETEALETEAEPETPSGSDASADDEF